MATYEWDIVMNLDEDEEIVPLSSFEMERDPFYGIAIVVRVQNMWARGQITAIHVGSLSGDRLYRVLFEDGYLLDLTEEEVRHFHFLEAA